MSKEFSTSTNEILWHFSHFAPAWLCIISWCFMPQKYKRKMGGCKWSVSNFPRFLHFESQNAISNFRWRLSIVTVKSCNQFIVKYHSQPLLPTEVYYLSRDYKWRRKRRERERDKKGSWNKQNHRRPWNSRTPAETAGRISVDGDSLFEASQSSCKVHNAPVPAYLTCSEN